MSIISYETIELKNLGYDSSNYSGKNVIKLVQFVMKKEQKKIINVLIVLKKMENSALLMLKMKWYAQCVGIL